MKVENSLKLNESSADKLNNPDQFNTTLDLGRLAVFNNLFFKNEPNENEIIENANKNLGVLFSQLFKLRTMQLGDSELERDYSKPLYSVNLPTPIVNVPRSKSIPKNTKTLTKWEQFMKDKGISKKKKDRMVWSEKLQKYLPRWGKDSIKQTELRTEAIIEDNPKYEGKNPFTYKKQEGKLEHIKNKKREVDNKDKYLNKKREKDVKLKENSKQHKEKFEIAQKSTASQGRFDKKLKDEKKINELKHKKVSSEIFKSIGKESERNSKLVSKMLK